MRKRLPFPYEFLWIDKQKKVHRCMFLTDDKESEHVACSCGCDRLIEKKIPTDLYELLAIIKYAK